MKKKAIKSGLARIDRMKDSEIDYSDIPALDKTFLKRATIVAASKEAVDDPARCRRAELAQGKWPRLSDAHQQDPKSRDGKPDAEGQEKSLNSHWDRR